MKTLCQTEQKVASVNDIEERYSKEVIVQGDFKFANIELEIRRYILPICYPLTINVLKLLFY